jgi:hypothetical protein
MRSDKRVRARAIHVWNVRDVAKGHQKLQLFLGSCGIDSSDAT